MSVILLRNESEFEAALSSTPTAVILASAAWCGPCRHIKPSYMALANEFPNVPMYMFDVDEANELASKLGVSSMPTFIFYHRGKLDKFVGANLFPIRQLLDMNRIASTFSNAPMVANEVQPMDSFGGLYSPANI